MKRHEFIRKIDQYSPIINGYGQRIADIAEVSYTTYQNYKKGFGKDPEVMERILIACEVVKEEIATHIQQLNSTTT